MFNHLFENRNTTVTNLLKLGDCIGRSLRENIEIFSIDSDENKVAYLTESGKVITGVYELGSELQLADIRVQESDIFSDNEVFDSHVTSKVSEFVGNVNTDSYNDANVSFSDILDLWESRIKFENVKKRLDEKAVALSETDNILDTDTFSKLKEIMPLVKEFLVENIEDIKKVTEIKNATMLSNSVSKAFNFPRMTPEQLQESRVYKVNKDVSKSVYELVCKQELVAKELLESKNNFQDVWATNPKIRNLSTLIFNNDDEVILESLVEAVLDIPFLALATKKQLTESIDNAVGLVDTDIIGPKDVKEYVSKIYEMKKPLKKAIIDVLNEKYGINIQTLKDAATFSSLANTQVVIFESLARLSPKGSTLRSTLSEVSTLLKGKNGVEVIDVNDFLQECFEECGYSEFCGNLVISENLSFEDILEQEYTAEQLLEKAKSSLMDKVKASEEELSPEQKKDKKKAEEDEMDPSSKTDMEDDSVKKAEKNGDKKTVKEETEESEEEIPDDPDSEGEEEEEPLTKEEFIDALASIEKLANEIKDEESDVDDEDES